MKRQPVGFLEFLRSLFLRSNCKHIAILGLFAMPYAFGASPGELDITFSPDPAVVGGATSRLTVDHGFVYFATPTNSFRRLRENGSWDESWTPSPRVLRPHQSLTITPFGGWAIVSSSGLPSLVEELDGSLRWLPSFGRPFAYDYFPQDDGSVVGFGLGRMAADGREDYAFALPRSITDASSLGVIPTAVQDAGGRFIVAGNFRTAGGVERLGLVRFNLDGRPDLTWNPGPALGISFNETNGLTWYPYSIAPGVRGAVVVGLRLVSTNPAPDLRIAIIEADGTVSAEFKNYGQGIGWPVFVQPDGKLLVNGLFDRWGDWPAAGLVRLNPDGSVDQSFQVTLTGERAIWVRSVTGDSSGRVWFSGTFEAVNGVPRPGLARVFAWDPTNAAPALERSFTPPKIAVGEILHLTARVTGHPTPQLQWYRDGEPLAGATNRGLRLPVESAASLGLFELTATNEWGTQRIEFPPVVMAQRSASLGKVDPDFEVGLTNFTAIKHIVPLPDGKVLVAGAVQVVRLDHHWQYDQSFGSGGVASVSGPIESLRALDSGHVLVCSESAGLVELDRHGQRVERSFPTFQPPHVTEVAPHPSGGYFVGGRFTQVEGTPAVGLVLLQSDFSVNLTFHSPLQPGQSVERLEVDSQGRLLVAGERAFASTPSAPPPIGLIRLRDDGSLDPTFQRVNKGIRYLIVEPDHSLVVGMPLRRLSADGGLLREFDTVRSEGAGSSTAVSRYSLSRLLDGGFVGIRELAMDPYEVIRWRADGSRDFAFFAQVGTGLTLGPRIQATAALADGTIILGVLGGPGPRPVEVNRRLVRLLPDTDLRLQHPRLAGGEFFADLATQPGREYRIGVRDELDREVSEVLGPWVGDGYLVEMSAPASATSGFLELQSAPRR